MASTPPNMRRQSFQSVAGANISYLTAGPDGARTVLLIHGFVSDAEINWVKGGVVSGLVDAGFHVVAPDLRGHGLSDKPHAESAYPDDVLALDQEALIKHLGLSDFHLVGYSLGAITAGRLVVRGTKPRSLTLCGIGIGITDATTRRDLFVDALLGRLPKDDAFGQMVSSFVKRTKGDAMALAQVMRGRQAVEEADLKHFDLPCLVLNGEKDNDNGSGEALAELIPGAQFQSVPGTHMDAIFKPEFARAIVDWIKKAN